MRYIVANWKMYLNYNQSNQLLKQFTKLTLAPQIKLVICPSFTSLNTAHTLLKDTSISIGSQDCSAHSSGAYTGEISAQTLKEVGCSYCLVGHSEQRRYHNETDLIIAQKISQLVSMGITPILTIGEQKKNVSLQDIQAIITKQLKIGLSSIPSPTSVIIAYEPYWAIGSDTVPELENLERIISFIQSTLKTMGHTDAAILYGGNVNQDSIKELQPILGLNGFIIGRASCNLPSLTKILEHYKIPPPGAN